MRTHRVFFETYGCQMNKLDSELILGDLMRDGTTATHVESEADLIIVNTCSVREHAEDRVFSRLGELKAAKRTNPDLVIALIGCMAQKEGQAIVRRMPHIDLVCGTHQYPHVPRFVREIREAGLQIVAIDEVDGIDLDWRRNPGARSSPTQAFVLAMKGCDCRCTFCVVPYTRGTELSRPIPDILEEVRALVADGVQEVTLLGQNITSYGKNLSPSAPQYPLVEARPERRPAHWETNLARLLQAVHEVPGLRRIRFITGHPAFVDRALLETMRDFPKVAPFLHVPAQSGSNRMLKRMKRGYTREEYLEMAALGRELVPDLAIAGDFIVGFPGETDEDFAQSVDLMEQVKFHTCFVFKYSPRPNTPAIKLPNDVPEAVKRERNQVLLQLQERQAADRQQAAIGRDVEILVEGPSKMHAHRQVGRARWNQLVMFEDPRDWTGQFVTVRIHRATALTLHGRLLDPAATTPALAGETAHAG